MIGIAMLRWLFLLAALLALGVLIDRVLLWLDRQGVIRYGGGRSGAGRGDSRGRTTVERFRRPDGSDRAPEGFSDDPFPRLDPDELEEEEEDEEPPDNVYPFH